jgi:hypothetical protein
MQRASTSGVRRFGGPDNDTGYELALDNHQNLYYCNRMTEVYNLGFAPGEDFVIPTTLERAMLMRIDQENNYRGFVFRDLNSNQLRDPGEPGFPEVVIEVPEKNLFSTTLEGGHYRLYYSLDADTVRPLALRPYWTITPAFAVSDTLNPVMNFAVTFPPDYRDVSVKAFSLGTFRPGFTTNLEIHVTNWSSQPIDSIAVTLNDFNLAPAFTFVEATPLPDVLDANQALWYSDTLVPGETAVIAVRLKTPANILLDTPIDLAVVAAYPNDVNPADDTTHIISAVVGSYDPNDKLVFPTQVEIQDLDASLLYYTIRFQNTGTAAAEFVILRDTLLAGLNPASIQMIGASHPYTWRLHDANIFEVRFDTISLPDSTTNLEGSQGFVAFTLKPDRNLAVGDTVYNRAGIYFDYNAPIMTPLGKSCNRKAKCGRSGTLEQSRRARSIPQSGAAAMHGKHDGQTFRPRRSAATGHGRADLFAKTGCRGARADHTFRVTGRWVVCRTGTNRQGFSKRVVSYSEIKSAFVLRISAADDRGNSTFAPL